MGRYTSLNLHYGVIVDLSQELSYESDNDILIETFVQDYSGMIALVINGDLHQVFFGYAATGYNSRSFSDTSGNLYEIVHGENLEKYISFDEISDKVRVATELFETSGLGDQILRALENSGLKCEIPKPQMYLNLSVD